jgi:toxin ParE1/3/4
VLGSKARDDIFPGVRTLHVARQGYNARHFIIFRGGAGQSIEVLRLLHDSMELARHLPDADLTEP